MIKREIAELKTLKKKVTLTERENKGTIIGKGIRIEYTRAIERNEDSENSLITLVKNLFDIEKMVENAENIKSELKNQIADGLKKEVLEAAGVKETVVKAEKVIENNDIFKGVLRGNDVKLENIEMKKIFYKKRTAEELNELRNNFNNSERKKFLVELTKESDALKKAGLNEKDIIKLKNGRVPDGWQVHHKLPLDDGGTNSMDNLVLIKNEPYHKVITNYQNMTAKKMKVGEVKRVNWPIPKGKIYPKTKKGE